MPDLSSDQPDKASQKHEPLFNAPLLALMFPLLIIIGYGLQTFLGTVAEDDLIEVYALKPTMMLHQGQYSTLISHQFLHGSWMHALFNSVFCLAFATPVVRAFGKGIGGGVSYIAYFLVCGTFAGLGYSLLNPTSAMPVLGASGAISGLLGAAIRLQGRPGRIERLTHPRVLSMSFAWCGINALSAFIPQLMGAEQGQGIAWQAHVAGYVFGLLTIGVWLRLFHPRYFTRS